jgi:hypothetical protein
MAKNQPQLRIDILIQKFHVFYDMNEFYFFFKPLYDDFRILLNLVIMLIYNDKSISLHEGTSYERDTRDLLHPERQLHPGHNHPVRPDGGDAGRGGPRNRRPGGGLRGGVMARWTDCVSAASSAFATVSSHP